MDNLYGICPFTDRKLWDLSAFCANTEAMFTQLVKTINMRPKENMQQRSGRLKVQVNCLLLLIRVNTKMVLCLSRILSSISRQ